MRLNIDALRSPCSVIATLHATVWSFPEEIETIDDAQEWEMQEVPLTVSDDEEYVPTHARRFTYKAHVPYNQVVS